VRVERCFAFLDLCGFTEFTEHHGDDRVVVVLAQLRTMLRESAARRGVRVVKWLGDGAMLSSTMVDAVAAMVVELNCRMTTEQPSLPIRAGVSAGPVIMFEGDDYIGRAVNVAARLCDHAAPRQILATDRVCKDLPPWIEAGGPRDLVLRGLRVLQGVRPLELARSDETVADPVCGLVIPARYAIEGPDGRCYCSEACATV
jgi:class 3 adenylate cyclase